MLNVEKPDFAYNWWVGKQWLLFTKNNTIKKHCHMYIAEQPQTSILPLEHLKLLISGTALVES